MFSLRLASLGPASFRLSAVFASAALLAVFPSAQAQTAHLLASETVVASGSNTAGVPVKAVRDSAGNTYDLTGGGAVYKLAPGCLDYSVCGGTAIIPATAGNVDVAVDTAGALYIVNSTAKTVTQYVAASGTYTGTLLFTETLTPVALDVDASGTMYLADNDATASQMYIVPAGCAASACRGSVVTQAANAFQSVRLDGLGSLFYSVNTGGNELLQEYSIGTTAIGSPSLLAAGTIPSIGVASDGTIYAGYIPTTGTAQLLQVTAGCTGSHCVFSLGDTTTPAAVVGDGNGGVTVYDALSASNRILDYGLTTSFGSVAVAATGTAQPISYFGFDSAGTLGSISVMTKGVTGKDFIPVAAGTTCDTTTAHVQGDVCSVQASFTPATPGRKLGAITLNTGADSGTAIATAFLGGVGTGPIVVNSQGVTRPLGINGNFRGPSFDGAGNIYVGNGTLWKIDTSGGLTTLDSSGDVYFTGVDGAGNVFYEANGQLQELIGGQGSRVTRGALTSPDNTVALDSKGNIYYSDDNDEVIVKFDARTFAASTYLPNQPNTRYIAIAFDSSDNLFLADYNQSQVVEVIAGTQSPVLIADSSVGVSNPQGIAVDAAGNVYVSNSNNTIIRLQAGTYTSTNVPFDSSQINVCCGLAINPKGTLAISGNGTVGTLDRTMPAELDFTANIGSTTSAQSASLENDGNLPLTITAVAATPSAFTVDADSTTCAVGMLAAGAQCALGATFTASAPAGTTGGTISLTSNNLYVTGSTEGVTLVGNSVEIPQTITFPPPMTPVALNATATLAATSDSGLAVTYSIVSGTATLTTTNGVTTVTYTTAGRVVIEADQAGNTTYASAAPVQQSVDVQLAPTMYTAPSTAVGATAATQTVTLAFPNGATLNSTPATALQVTTQGALNLDFTFVSGGTCAAGATYAVNATCTVLVSFSPKYPGARFGAVTAYDTSATPVVQAQAFIGGTGTGPLGNFDLAPGQGNTGSVTDTIQTFNNDNASGIAIDALGNLYTVGFYDSSVSRIAVGATTATQLGTLPNGDSPRSIGVDGAGNIFIGAGSGTLYELPGGVAGTPVLATTLPSGYTFEESMAFDAGGNIYVSGTNGNNNTSSAFRISSIGPAPLIVTNLATLPNGDRAEGIASDAAGDLFLVLDNNDSITGQRGSVFEVPAGSSTANNLFATQHGSNSIAVDPAGNLYVDEFDNSLVHRYTASTYSEDVQPYQMFSGNWGLVQTGNGDIYVSQFGNGTIARINRGMPTLDQGPQTISFPTATQNLLLTSNGTSALTATALGVTGPFSLASATTCTATSSLAVGAGCALSVQYTPTAPGAQTGSINITDNSNNAVSPANVQQVLLTGTGQTAVIGAYTIALPATDVAGTPVTATITALDQNGNPYAGYSGTVNLSSSDPQATFPATATIVAGSATVSFTPKTAGSQYLAAADAVSTGAQGSTYLMVTPAALAQIIVPATATAKTSQIFTIVVNATDAYGNAVSGAPVSIAVPATGSSAVPSANPVTTPANASFTQNATTGTYTITFTSGAVTATTEVTATLPDTFLVTINTDPSLSVSYSGVAGNCVNQTAGAAYQTGGTDNTLCSLRDAVAAANGTSYSVITFASTVASTATPGTITLADSIEVDYPVTITGPGSAALTINGSNDDGDGIWDIDSDDVTNLTGMTLLNADYLAIYNDGGILTLNDVTVQGGSNNAMETYGTTIVKNSSFLNSPYSEIYTPNTVEIGNTTFKGSHDTALDLDNGSVAKVTNSVFDSNSSSNGDAPAIYSDGQNLTITGSTFSNNSTTGAGAALYLDNPVTATIANSTFTGNSTTAYGSTIVSYSSMPATVTDSTFYGNSDADGGYLAYFANAAGTFTNSIVGGENGGSTYTNCAGCSFTGNNLYNVDAQLMALTNNGSPTPQTPVLQTLLPQPGSPAICAGTATSDSTDERGYKRPTVSGTTSCYDIGAVQTNYALAFTTQPSTTAAFASISPAPVVALTEQGNGVSSESVVITDSQGATSLSGATTVNTDNTGAATFSAIAPQLGGSQTLTATLNPAVTVTSNSFTVTAVAPTVTLAIVNNSQTYGDVVPSGNFTASAAYGGNPVAGTFTYTATPTSGTAVTLVQGTTILAPGAYTVTATFTPTDSATYSTAGSSSVSTNYTVNMATPALTVSAITATYGTATTATVTAGKYDNGVTPTGAIYYVFDATATTASSSLPLASGSVSIPVPATLTPGNHTLSVLYGGDGNYTSSSTSSTFTVAKAATTVPSIGVITATFGTATSTTVSVAATGGAATPTGTLYYAFDTTATTASSSLPLVSGAVSVPVAATLSAGSHTLSVLYSGDGNYATSSNSKTFTVAAAATGIVLATSANPSVFGQGVSFTATVTSTAGTPTGTVIFYDGGTALGNPVTMTAGAATYSTTALSIATHTITARFQANGNYAASPLSAAIAQLVVTPVPFTVTGIASPITLTGARGDTLYTVLTVTPSGYSTATVSFTCTGLPAGATCTFLPPTINVVAGTFTTQNVAFTVSTKTQLTASARPSPGMTSSFAMMLWLPGLLLAGAAARSKKLRGHQRLLMLAIFFCGMLGLGLLTGCGSSGPTYSEVPAGTYNFNIVATAGSTVQTVPVVMNLQ